MENNINNVQQPVSNPGIASSFGSNLIAGMVLTASSLFFVLIGNYLYIAIFAILVVNGNVDINTGPTMLSIILSVIVPAIMVWLGVLSSKSYLKKKQERFNLSQVVLYSTVVFVLVMFGSLYSNSAGAVGQVLTFGNILKVTVVSVIFYLSSRYYPKTASSPAAALPNVTTNHRQFSRWGYKIGITSVFFVMTYFLMVIGMILSPIGLIVSVINLIVGVKQHDKKDIGFAIIGIVLNIIVLGMYFSFTTQQHLQ
jgi:hypothetical protein